MVFSPNSVAVRFGRPGKLYAMPTANVAAAEAVPMTAVSAIPASAVPLGFTTTGSSFGYNLATGAVEVAEELDRFATAETGRTANVTVVLAETTYQNLAIAYNGGIITGDGAAWTLEAPELGSATRIALIWDENASPGSNTLRLLLRNVLASGNINRENRKGTNVAGIPVTFECDIAAGGLKPFKWFGVGALNPDLTP